MSDTAPRTDYPHGRRGFASMSREQVSAISSLGGKTAHRIGKAHEWTPETAREAGRKGGNANEWTDERRRRHSDLMLRFWADRRQREARRTA